MTSAVPNESGQQLAGADADALSVENLCISAELDSGRVVPVVDDVSFRLGRGEVLGLIGESGSGKTLTALSVLGLLPEPRVWQRSGNIRLNGQTITNLPWKDLRRVRGGEVGMVFQDPMTSLNPVMKVGDQLTETLLTHTELSPGAARRRAIELLEMVRIPQASKRVDVFPHELSGGMRQRVMIAMALSCDPTVLIADEPTTALDVTVQAEILELVSDLQENLGMAVLFISHDLSVIRGLADRVAIMYAGRIVESADTETIFGSPQHPYTAGLLAAVPSLSTRVSLVPIPGSPPVPGDLPQGCPFSPRCSNAVEQCSERPLLAELGSPGHHLACWNPLTSLNSGVVDENGFAEMSDTSVRPNDTAILNVKDLSVVYSENGGRRPRGFLAVDRVSLEVYPGETLGLVGESGSGKSSLARAILQLQPMSGGQVVLEGADLSQLRSKALRSVRRNIQIVFQDPYASLNPRKTVEETLTEPLLVHEDLSADERSLRVAEALQNVGLPSDAASRYPSEFSGGQRQRIGIARAFILDPRLVICDEPVASLDVSIQAQILNLLEAAQARTKVAMLFIAHDLSVIRHISDRVAVMFAGKIVEVGDASSVFEDPQHPYTKALIAAVPSNQPPGIVNDSSRGRQLASLVEMESTPTACPFAPRCPDVQDICLEQQPLLERNQNGTWSACHMNERA